MARVIQRNIAACGLGDRARLFRGEALSLLSRIEARGERFDIVFLDPPYDSSLGRRALRRLGGSSLLEEGATVVLEHPPGRPPAGEAEGLETRRTVSYGDTCLSYLEAASP